MHISLRGFVAGPDMKWIKVDEEIFDHVGKRIVHCPPLAGEVLQLKRNYKLGVDIECRVQSTPFR